MSGHSGNHIFIKQWIGYYIKMKYQVDIERLDEQSWMISEGSGKGRTHSYLLTGSSYAVVIDTGLGLMNLKKITDKLCDKEVYVVNTHGHLDHISRNYQYKKAYLHPLDEPIFQEHSSYAVRYMFFSKRYLDKGYPSFFCKLPIIRGRLKRQSTMLQHDNRVAIREGDILDLGGRSLKIIETPGHTKGSICILDQERKWLFTGDSLCEKGVLLHFDHSTSLQIFLTSLNKLKEHKDEFEVLYPGHQKVGLDTSWIDAYIDCAQQIIHGHATPKENRSAAGIGYVFAYGKASISYLPKHIYEESEG